MQKQRRDARCRATPSQPFFGVFAKVAAVLALGCSAVSVAYADQDNALKLCGWGDIKPHGEYGLHNNVWGAKRGRDAPENFVQCMSEPFGDGAIGAAFQWKFLLPSQSVKSYPHVTYGWDFAKPYPAKMLPVKVANLKKLVVEYDYDIQSSARYNVSFDLWLSDAPSPKRADLKTEIMIWVERNLFEQKRKRLASPMIAGQRYDYYAGPVPAAIGQWTYVAFVSHGRTRSASIDLAPYIHYVADRNKSGAGAYVNGIHFGAELTEGAGSFKINKFRVLTVEG